jgi:hypothetical protein
MTENKTDATGRKLQNIALHVVEEIGAEPEDLSAILGGIAAGFRLGQDHCAAHADGEVGAELQKQDLRASVAAIEQLAIRKAQLLTEANNWRAQLYRFAHSNVVPSDGETIYGNGRAAIESLALAVACIDQQVEFHRGDLLAHHGHTVSAIDVPKPERFSTLARPQKGGRA